MKKNRYSTEQIIAILKQAEMGLAVSDLIRQIGISEQIVYSSRARTSSARTNISTTKPFASTQSNARLTVPYK